MKKITTLFGFLMLVLLGLNGCFVGDMDKDYEALLKSRQGQAGSTSGACPKGTWKTSVCGGTRNVIYNFDPASNKGYSITPLECTGMCTPMKVNFTYSISGNTITYQFTGAEAVTCTNGNSGTLDPPKGNFSMTYTCKSDGTLVTEVVNIQTGVKTSYTFTRQ